MASAAVSDLWGIYQSGQRCMAGAGSGGDPVCFRQVTRKLHMLPSAVEKAELPSILTKELPVSLMFVEMHFLLPAMTLASLTGGPNHGVVSAAFRLVRHQKV